jgi:hypothetical protein
MFEKHEIWDRSEDHIIIYIVFRDLDTDLHYVQQAKRQHAAQAHRLLLHPAGSGECHGAHGR